MAAAPKMDWGEVVLASWLCVAVRSLTSPLEFEEDAILEADVAEGADAPVTVPIATPDMFAVVVVVVDMETVPVVVLRVYEGAVVEVAVFVTVLTGEDAVDEETPCDEDAPGDDSDELAVTTVVAIVVPSVVAEEVTPCTGPRFAPPINPVDETR